MWAFPKIEGLAPGPRGGHACVSVGSKVIVFGGSDRAPVTYDDLWVLDTADSELQWTRISPVFMAGCTVHPRSGASLTAVGNLVYLFGGQEPLTEFRFNDIKVLDTNSWTWADAEVEGSSPPARHSHTSGCLANQCVIIYGGSGYEGATLGDLWVYNPAQKRWDRPTVSGTIPAPREMHSGCMVDPTTMLVFGGRSGDNKILCDAAVFDAKEMKWTAVEPTPFSRCAHSSVAIPAADGEAGASGSVLIYGGFSGEAVEGDVLKIDSKSLEIELVRRGPRSSDKAGTVPTPRFAHTAVAVPWPTLLAGKLAMVVFGGVNPAADLNDVVAWLPS